jgi:hypothetical protein
MIMPSVRDVSACAEGRIEELGTNTGASASRDNFVETLGDSGGGLLVHDQVS